MSRTSPMIRAAEICSCQKKAPKEGEHHAAQHHKQGVGRSPPMDMTSMPSSRFVMLITLRQTAISSEKLENST